MRRAGEFCLSAIAGVESGKLPFTTLLEMEPTMLSLNSDLRPDCARLDASPVAGVRTTEEPGPDGGSTIKDADP